jgi:hypothetical protein
MVMEAHDRGLIDDPVIVHLRNARLWPSTQTIHRWVALRDRFGHCRPCQRSGNIRATVLRDHDLFLLALYRVVYPKATATEINAFLYRANFGNLNFRFYTPSQISEAEDRIGLSRVAGSTTAYQAFFPINMRKRWNFWNLAYPLGIADIRRTDFIDLDECGLFVETGSRGYGKCYIGKRVNEEGPYSKSEKWNLLLAISGDPTAERWKKMWLEGGTTNTKMIDFIQDILDDIGPGTPQRRRCFIMDNLTSHHNAQVSALIHTAGHRLVFRAPYYPVDGPIEYVFNSLQVALWINMHQIRTGANLLHEVHTAIANMQTFEPYFMHCGFWRD